MNNEEAEGEQNEEDENALMPSPDDIIDSEEIDARGARGSIFFDIQKKCLTYSPLNKVANSIQSNKPQSPNKKISSKYLESLTPDKLSELKYIFQICDPQNIGEFSFSSVEKCNSALIAQYNI